MENKENRVFEDISPDHLSGSSSGSHIPQRSGERIDNMLLYTLGKEFLTQKIPDRLYDAYVESFCEKLLLLFTADDIPKIEQVNDDGGEYTSFAYTAEPTQISKERIHRLVGWELAKHPSFARQWQYYIHTHGLDNILKAHAILDTRKKDDIDEATSGTPYAVGVGRRVGREGQNIQYDGEVIPDVATMYAQEKRIEAEKNSIKKGLGLTSNEKIQGEEDIDRNRFGNYIARMCYFGYDLRKQYDMEFSNTNPKAWRLAILASLIAYQTTDKKEFYRMMARKMGHLSQIAESIRGSYSRNVQKDHIMPYQIVWEQVHYKFNYVLLQELISSYYRSLDEAYPRDTKSSRSHGKDARIVKYKSTFHQGLLDAQEGDISEPVMDRLLDKEVDMQHRFAKRVIDAKERKKRMLTYISIYYPDYKLIDSPDAMVQEDIFSFDHNQLENYINTSDDGLLRCCAIWLYAFNAPTMMEFSQRFQKFAPILESHKTFGELVEEELKEVYEPVHFKYAYEQLDMEALYIVLCHCRDAMEDCLGMTRSTNMQFEYSYDNEHMRYSSAVVLALYPEKKEKELPDVYGTYLDMVKDYTARKGFDDEDGEEA